MCRDLSLLHSDPTGFLSNEYQALFPRECSDLGVKVTAYISFTTEVNNMYSYTSTPPYVLVIQYN
jgi:hypothetical protein